MSAALEWLAPAANGDAAAQEWLAEGILAARENGHVRLEADAARLEADAARLDDDEASAQQWMQGIGGGAATGLSMGAAGGPWGLAIGAAIGAILGALQTALNDDASAGATPHEPHQDPGGVPYEPHQEPGSVPMRQIASPPPSGAAGTGAPDIIGQILALVPGVADLLRRPVVSTTPAPPQGSAPAPPAHGESEWAADDHDIGEGVPATHAAEGPAPAPDYPLAARFVPAAPDNFEPGSGARAIRRIVIHITDSGPQISETINWFQDPDAGVSAHYVVGQDGEVVQMVHHDDVAWHARGANADSIGIEHVANTRGLVPTVIEYVSSAGLTRWLADLYQIPIDRRHIVGHSEVAQTNHVGCPNAVWDWDYFMRLVTGAVSMAPREP